MKKSDTSKTLKQWSIPNKIDLNISFTCGKPSVALVEGANPNQPPCTRPNPPAQCFVGPS